MDKIYGVYVCYDYYTYSNYSKPLAVFSTEEEAKAYSMQYDLVYDYYEIDSREESEYKCRIISEDGMETRCFMELEESGLGRDGGGE